MQFFAVSFFPLKLEKKKTTAADTKVWLLCCARWTVIYKTMAAKTPVTEFWITCWQRPLFLLFSVRQKRDLCHGLNRSVTKPFCERKLGSMIKKRLILEQDIAILNNRDSENSLNSTSERKCTGETEQLSLPRFTESPINVNKPAKSRNTIHIEKDGEGELYVE